MTSALCWLFGIIAFGLIGGKMHTARLGPLRLLSRSVDVLRACGYVAERCWEEMERTAKRDWESSLARARRER